MGERLSRAYRGLATGLCFAVFGLGEIVCIAWVVAVLTLFVRAPARRTRLGRKLCQLNFKWFVGLMRRAGVLSYEAHHLERLNRPGLLVVANHPTLIDIVFLISFIERADCIVKGSLTENPFTRHAIRAAGFIPNSVTGLELVKRCSDSLDEGNTLIIFPEGSRSEPGRLLPFQRGLSHIAVRSKRDLTPVVIRVSEHNLGRRSRWWKAPRQRVHFSFHVEEDIRIAPFLARHGEFPAAARDLTQFLSSYFDEQLEAPSCSTLRHSSAS